MRKRRQRRLNGQRKAAMHSRRYQEGGEVDELYDYQGEQPSVDDIRPAPDTPQQTINYDDRYLQQMENVEGAMEELGTEPDPDVSGGRGVREHENWPYTEEGEEDPTPGRRASYEYFPQLASNEAPERYRDMLPEGSYQRWEQPQQFKRGGPVRGNKEHAVLRKMTKAPKRGYKKTGYAAGGSVGYGVSGPVMMSVALDSRSSNADHAVEDAGPLATRPEGAPSLPSMSDEQGYRRGGSVRKTGYQEGGDVEYEDEDNTQSYGTDIPEEPEEPEFREPEEPEFSPSRMMEDEWDEGIPEGRQGGGEEGEEDQASPEQAGRQEQAEEEGEEEEGGGGRGAPTGYNAPPQDQDDRDPDALRAQEEAAQEPVGFQPQQPAGQDDPEQQLREALDWTRKQFGLDKDQQPQQMAQAQPAEQEQPAGRPSLPAGQAPVGLPPPPSTAPPESVGPEEGRPRDPNNWDPNRLDMKGYPGEQKFTPNIPPLTGPGGGPRVEGGAQPQAVSGVQGPAAPAGAPKQLTDYLRGERNFTPEQMTQLLDRATQENPNLDQSGSIRRAFQDLMGKGDMDGASRFVQSLRPSYDNLRAAMVAATSEGKFVEALQIAEKLNNIIPNGNQVDFHPTENGLITAIVRPESGEPARTYHLTPQQFQDYAKGPASVFDIAADKGIDATLQAAMQGPAQNPENAPPYQVAGPMMPPPTRGIEAPPGTPLPQPRPAEAGPPATPETPLAQAQRIAAGLPGQAPTATPQPVGQPTGQTGQTGQTRPPPPGQSTGQTGQTRPPPPPATASAPSATVAPPRPAAPAAAAPRPAAAPTGRVDTEGRMIGPARGQPVPPAAAAEPPQRYDTQGRPIGGVSGRSGGPEPIERPTGYQAGKQQADQRPRDPDGWPTGIPRGGSFANTPGNATRDFSEPIRFGRTGHVSGVGRAGSAPVYDVNGHTYNVGKDGMPIAREGQPGWRGQGDTGDRSPRMDQPPVRGERRAPERQDQQPGGGQTPWGQSPAGRVQPVNPGQQPRDGEIRVFPGRSEAPAGGRYPPSGGSLPVAPPYSARYNWDSGRWEPIGPARFNQQSGQWEPATGYRQAQQPQSGGPGTEQRLQQMSPEDRRRTLNGQQPLQQLSPQDPRRQPAGQTGQLQPQQTQQQQPQGRKYGDPYTGTPEQKRDQYQQDMKEWGLRERARQMYPNQGDEDKRTRALETLRGREGTQQRHGERQIIEREKLNETNRRHRETQEGLNNRALMQRLTNMGMQSERLAFQDLQNRVKAWEAKPENKIGNAQFPYDEQDKQLLRKLRETAIENDMWQQQRPQMKQDPNINPKPTEPAAAPPPHLQPAPGANAPAEKPESKNPQKTIDGVTYEHDGKGWKRVRQ